MGFDDSRRAFLRSALRTFGGASVAAAAGPLLDELHAYGIADSSNNEVRSASKAASAASPIVGDRDADRVLQAAAELIVPVSGPGPSAGQAEVGIHLARVAQAPEFQTLRVLWQQSAPMLATAAQARTGAELFALPSDRGAAFLADCAEGTIGDPTHAARLQALVRSLLEFGLEGYFCHPRQGGNPGGIVWRAYGLDQMLATLDGVHHAHGGEPRGTEPSSTPDAERLLRQTWDAIVVGSGAGGAALAWRLTTHGLRVLVLEKGQRIDRGNLVHDEVAATRRNLFVPYLKDEPHVVVQEPGGRAERRRDGWTACCVGGGTVHMSAMLLRMHPEDFAGAYEQAAWPFGYAVMRPYYDLVEQLVGVSGVRDANPFDAPGQDFPLPPINAHPAARRVADAARANGWHPYETPRGILSRPYRQRAACTECPFCGSYACEVDAKAGADATFLRMAEATGHGAVVSSMRVVAVRAARGRADGVDVVDATGAPRTVRGKVVILAGGAVESTRLALLSRSADNRAGIGNDRDQVGRHVTGSYNAGLAGRFEFPGELFPAADDRHPFLNLAFQDLYDSGCGTIVVDRRPVSPIHHALVVATADRHKPLLGAALKEQLFLALARSRSVVVESFIPMRPHVERRITLDTTITDALQLPAARITLARKQGDHQRGRRIVDAGERLLRAARAAHLDYAVELEETPFLLVGGMRMGADPATSVTDPQGRIHGLTNVFVCDASVLPHTGGVPPTLTIMANAIRIADAIVARGA